VIEHVGSFGRNKIHSPARNAVARPAYIHPRYVYNADPNAVPATR
jgi:hypothetical protein